MKEVIADKLALQRQEILSHIPQPGQPTQPKSIIEQITDFVGAIGSLKEAGPTLRSILGVQEPSSNPASTALPVQLTGPDGKPIIMDLSNFISLEKFRGDERRADERHSALVGLTQTVRENLGDGILAIKAAAEEAKRVAGAKPPAPSQQQQVFKCGDCGKDFSPPAGWVDEPLKCPTCGREYSKEELLG
ncbi:hypothetical protein ES703_76412 [subsurface metagenome]